MPTLFDATTVTPATSFPVRSRAAFRPAVTFATAPASAPDMSLRARFTGALLGGMAGDTLGASVEGWTGTRVNETLDFLAQLPAHSLYRGLCEGALGALGGRLAPGRAPYTDDTEMIIGIAEALLTTRTAENKDRSFEQVIAARLAANFDGRRNYGSGVYSVLQRLRRGMSIDSVNAEREHRSTGDGGAGNSGASRVTPVALLYHTATPTVLGEMAARSASVTHAHPVGQAGAVLQAFAVASALQREHGTAFDASEFLQSLCRDFERFCEPEATAAFRQPLQRVGDLLTRNVPPVRRDVAIALGANGEGTGADALKSVPAALYAFLRHPNSLVEAVIYAIRLGGDTDTVASMAGALGGALLGESAIPTGWLLLLEEGERGHEYVRRLADGLYHTWQG